jgi:hypothetical protein
MSKTYYSVMDMYGSTAPVANIARAYDITTDVAYAVADYLVHGRAVPARLIEKGRSMEDVPGDFNRMVDTLRRYAEEYWQRYRGHNYEPKGQPYTLERREIL